MSENDSEREEYFAEPKSNKAPKIITGEEIDGTELEAEKGEYELALTYEENYLIQMVLPRSKVGNTNNESLNTYAALVRITSNKNYDWELSTGKSLDFEQSKDSEGNTARDVKSPSYEEMDELRLKYERYLDMVDTEEGREYILKRAWKEAGDIELEGIE